MNAQQLIVFSVNNEVYGLPINAVREVIKWQGSTHLPGSSIFFEGITNVRGDLYQTINFNSFLNATNSEKTEETRIILLAKEKIGLLVEKLDEIINIEEEGIHSLESMRNLLGSQVIDYVVSHDNVLISVLNEQELINQLVKKR